jgi:cytochrome c-type biogenesis protein CcmF
MTVELGHFALVLALVVACWQMLVPLYGAWKNNAVLMAQSRWAALAQFGLIGLAFLSLTHAYLVSDFSVLNVADNSHSAKPLIYKISGVWGNHEGSMLLWVLILSLFGASVAVFGTHLPATLRARVLAVQASIGVAFLAFILFASNPFLRLANPPIEGNGLNPILQDPALAFHPPFLYAGYVGLSISFSFAVAALLEGKVDAAWARWVRPWTLLSWAMLTIGIAMGSWWAYYELGWGGFWFWDPVENASFMPWLISTALLHSAIVVEKRGALKIWTILLSILAFSLSLVGTFLVRSGILTSVHAFAVDPERGFYILMILGIFVGGSLTLFAVRAPSLKAGGLFAPISREGGLVFNNLLLCAACASVLIGTLYPLALETITGDKISVGPPYFNLTFGPIILPLLLLMPIGPMLTWKRADITQVSKRIWVPLLCAIAVGFGLLLATQRGPWLAPVAVAIGAWAMFGSVRDILQRVNFGKVPTAIAWARYKGLPLSAHGSALAHAGLGLVVIGVVILTVWKEEHILTMKPGDVVNVAHYSVKFVGEEPLKGANYDGLKGRFLVSVGGKEVANIVSEKRIFKPSNMPTTEVGLVQGFFGDLYIVLGDDAGGGARNVRASYNPMATWIWLGAVIMFVGGFLSLSDRRLRIGVPQKAARVVMQAGE